MSKLYSIDETSLTNIANAIRNMRQETGTLTPAQMASKINDSRLGIPIDAQLHYSSTGWVRPNNYPDLDVLYSTISDTESRVYLTYDLTKTSGYGWIGIYAGGSTWYVDRGHISNGEFVADWTSSAQSASSFFRQDLDSTNGDVQLWCVRSAGNLTKVAFVANTGTTANNYYNNIQPCVERCGNLPYAIDLSSSVGRDASYSCFGTQWLEKDNLMVGKYSTVTTLGNMYNSCYNLQETSCGSWDTSNWTVTNLSYAFYRCYKLKELDLSDWDTSKWTISGTKLAYAWDECYSLETLDISTWDVSGFTITSLVNTWAYCFSLKELDLSKWNTASWGITTFANAWLYCMSLRKLDISTWNTASWTVTTFSSAWQYCLSLEKLNIQNWNTTNWAVTTLAGAWNYCHSLNSLDLSKWVTTNWAVTSLSSTWNACYSLESLNVSTWNTTNWAVTTLANTWTNCKSLTSLDLSGWVTTNWAVTTLSACWSNCSSLRDLKIGTWNTANWDVTTLSTLFNECYSMETIDLTSWNVSNWHVTTVYYMFYYTHGAKTINIGNWNTGNFALTESRYLYNSTGAETLLLPSGLHGTVANSKFTYNANALINFAPPSIDIAQNYSNSTRLTRQSLLTIIDRLPSVSTSTTLTLGNTNKLKLTAEEIAVATQKGWTVA